MIGIKEGKATSKNQVELDIISQKVIINHMNDTFIKEGRKISKQAAASELCNRLLHEEFYKIGLDKK